MQIKNRDNVILNKYNFQETGSNPINRVNLNPQRVRETEGEQNFHEHRRAPEIKDIWKTPQRKIPNKPRRRIGRQFEAVEEQIHKGIEDIRAAGEEQKTNNTWETPQRKISSKPRRRIRRQFEAVEEQIYKGT